MPRTVSSSLQDKVRVEFTVNVQVASLLRPKESLTRKVTLAGPVCLKVTVVAPVKEFTAGATVMRSRSVVCET